MLKKTLLLGATMALITSTSFAASNTVLKTDKDKLSYTIGYQIGKSFKAQGISIKLSMFRKGLSAGLNGKKPILTEAEMTAVQEKFRKEAMAKMKAKQDKLGVVNAKKSDAFMAKVAKEKGVKMIEKGLYYKVITAGKGKMPTAKDTVVVNYEGTLSDGTVFDSSYKRKEPATFRVDQVIPGWTKALQKMPVGSTWELYIAPNLAYGKFAPPSIGPNQALKFKVELLSIKKQSTEKK